MQRVFDAIKPHVSGAMRRRVVRARLATRQLTARFRVLPDFLVIGAMRCGTSSLYKYLGYHPWIAPSLRKETEFLSTAHNRGEDWYRAHFPLAARKTVWSAAGKGLLTFEASPDYIFGPHVAHLASRLVPDAKVILLVRDPVARAYSHHRHVSSQGWETLDFIEALETEEERTASDRLRMEQDPYFWGWSYMAFSYAARGMYADQLARWRLYYPPDRILVLPSEKLYTEPAHAYGEVLDFLGLPPFTPRFPNYSAPAGPRTLDSLDSSIVARLTERFREPNEQLFAMVGRDFGWNDRGHDVSRAV
jgi:hypothetical protein